MSIIVITNDDSILFFYHKCFENIDIRRGSGSSAAVNAKEIDANMNNLTEVDF